MPAPIGMNFKTSAAGLKRFRSEYLRILSDERQLQEYLRNKKEKAVLDQAFQTANNSDDSFRQNTALKIRKRLFQAVNNSQSDYHEIRWLIKSLEMLRSFAASGSSSTSP
jgi:hypothetical protein